MVNWSHPSLALKQQCFLRLDEPILYKVETKNISFQTCISTILNLPVGG